MKRVFGIICTLACIASLNSCSAQPGERWSEEKANAWYESMEWPVGCDYVPAYAGNQIQMWQSSTWDPEVIDRELGWAEQLGFNSLRIFLHDKVWKAEREAFFSHVDEFLKIADSHGMTCLVTLFTNGGSEQRYVGEEISPVPGIHNSIWAQTPGESVVNNPEKWNQVKEYEQDVLRRYKDDKRIIAWCLYNEPENVPSCKTLPLLKKVFEWAREINPSQPLTAPIYTRPFSQDNYRIDRFPVVTYVCENSDIISLHCYKEAEEMDKFIKVMKTLGRPVFCTEYLARTFGSTFEDIMPILKANKVAAYNFGLVKGAIQCHYPWNDRDSAGVKIPFTEEPELWFHDILNPDGTPYRQSEVDFIKSMTSKK